MKAKRNTVPWSTYYDAIIIAGFDGNLLGVNQRSENTLTLLSGRSWYECFRASPTGGTWKDIDQLSDKWWKGKHTPLLDSKVLRKDEPGVPVDIPVGNRPLMEADRLLRGFSGTYGSQK